MRANLASLTRSNDDHGLGTVDLTLAIIREHSHIDQEPEMNNSTARSVRRDRPDISIDAMPLDRSPRRSNKVPPGTAEFFKGPWSESDNTPGFPAFPKQPMYERDIQQS